MQVPDLTEDRDGARRSPLGLVQQPSGKLPPRDPDIGMGAHAGHTDLDELRSLGLEERLEVGMQAGMVRGLAQRFALEL